MYRWHVILTIWLCKCILHCNIFIVCMFMTCSTSHCLVTLKDLWNVYMYACIYKYYSILSFVEEFLLCTGVDNLSLSNKNFLKMAFKKFITNVNRMYTYIPLCCKWLYESDITLFGSQCSTTSYHEQLLSLHKCFL